MLEAQDTGDVARDDRTVSRKLEVLQRSIAFQGTASASPLAASRDPATTAQLGMFTGGILGWGLGDVEFYFQRQIALTGR